MKRLRSSVSSASLDSNLERRGGALRKGKGCASALLLGSVSSGLQEEEKFGSANASLATSQEPLLFSGRRISSAVGEEMAKGGNSSVCAALELSASSLASKTASSGCAPSDPPACFALLRKSGLEAGREMNVENSTLEGQSCELAADEHFASHAQERRSSVKGLLGNVSPETSRRFDERGAETVQQRVEQKERCLQEFLAEEEDAGEGLKARVALLVAEATRKHFSSQPVCSSSIAEQLCGEVPLSVLHATMRDASGALSETFKAHLQLSPLETADLDQNLFELLTRAETDAAKAARGEAG